MKFNTKKYKEFLYETGRIAQKYHVELVVDRCKYSIQILQKKGLNRKTIAFIVLDKKAETRPIFEIYYQLEDRFRTELFNHLMRYTTSLNEESDDDEEKYYLRHKLLHHNDDDFGYLAYYPLSKEYWISTRESNTNKQTQFVENEIEDIKAVHNVTLEDFEMIRIENEN